MNELSIDSLQAVIMDFDGVLTNNLVYVSQEGLEMVRCSRSDGIAIESLHALDIKAFVVSTEKNNVVKERAKKLKIKALTGISDKSSALKELSIKEKFDLSKVIYVGNDLNDYKAMKLCGFSACPSDSHVLIKEIVTYTLSRKGGSGVIRELVEEILDINILTTLYS
jgi:YrbI family 3-deoxy-D-manno-octulosonate 8-phosphate phosphatase